MTRGFDRDAGSGTAAWSRPGEHAVDRYRTVCGIPAGRHAAVFLLIVLGFSAAIVFPVILFMN
jgi:hypothetical protein